MLLEEFDTNTAAAVAAFMRPMPFESGAHRKLGTQPASYAKQAKENEASTGVCATGQEPRPRYKKC